jgi:hypothetical protein
VKIDGIPVYDAAEPLILQVSKGDLQNAVRFNPAKCAFAQACWRELDIEDVRIHLGCVYLRGKGSTEWARYLTPKSLRSEIVVYDRGGAFTPGEFVLKCPCGTKRNTGRRKGANTWVEGNGKRRQPPHVMWGVRGQPRVERD